MHRVVEELWGGRPRSVAVTVKEYSALSECSRGEDERSSPVEGLREKRSALGPREGERGREREREERERGGERERITLWRVRA